MRISRRLLTFVTACLVVFATIVTTAVALPGRTPQAHAATALPSSYFAPYQDITIGPSLQSVVQATGQKYFTLAFITGNGCNAEWAGTIPLNQTSTYLPHLDSDISYIRGQGGDVIISFGGAAGQELALVCGTVSDLQAQYQAVVSKYGASHLDFDIEGGTEGDYNSYSRRNQALAALQQANPGLTISFTLPSGTSGLLSDSISMLNNAISAGVNFNVVNLMTMDYGSPNSQMGQAAISAANGLYSQLQSMFPSKSSSQLWSMVGITPMIGQNDSSGEIFSLSNASQVLSFAQSNKIGELAFWEISRDNGNCAGSTTASDTCSGVSQSTYQYTNTFKPFSNGGGNGGSGAPVGHTIWLQTTNNYNYVSARIDQTNSPLQASVTQVQAWEEFDVVDAGNGLIALRSHANNNYVSVRISQTNAPLEAIATQIQAWEEFTWLPQSNGTVALQAVANNNYVSARTNQTNTPLDANVTLIQGWEQFTWGQIS